jgi:endonuclease/exonuclease/phosphatase family metal-dependent hydrolase
VTRERGLPVALVLATGAVVEIALQCWRALFPLAYHLVGSLGFALTPIVVLAVFATPMLAWPLWRWTGPRLTVGVAVALVVVRLVLQAGPTLTTAIVAAVVALVAVTVTLPLVAGRRFGADALAAGTLVGLGLDVALRSWRVTDDVVWTQDWSAWLDPSLLLPIVLLLATAGSLTGRPHRAAPTWTWFVLLMPQLLLWTSLAFVGSSADVPFPIASAVLLLGVAAAMAVLAWPRARLPWYAAGGALLAVAALVPRLDGWPVLALAVLGTVTAPLLLREAAARPALAAFSAQRQASAAAGGAVTMAALLVLYPLHYELPLPFDNAWLPPLAVGLACLPMLRRPGVQAGPREFAVPSRLHAPAILLVAGGAGVLGLLTHLGMVGGAPAPGPDPVWATGPPEQEERRVATFNVGQGQDASTGRLDLRATARALVALDADVVALQEVARGWPLTSMTDMDAWLRAHTDLTITYAPAADRQFGNALVARVPLSDVTILDLGQGGGAQRRSAQRAVLDDGMVVYGTHLQARNTATAEQTRLDQMRLLVADWDGRPATVIAGDLNPRNEYADASETPPTRISNLEVFTDAGLVTTQPTSQCTAPTSNDNCSDYVFTSPDVEVLAPTAVIDTGVADHLPVRSVLRTDHSVEPTSLR